MKTSATIDNGTTRRIASAACTIILAGGLVVSHAPPARAAEPAARAVPAAIEVPDGNRPLADPAFVAPDAIRWLLLRVVGTKPGPAGGDTLSAARYVQRVNTSGGVAPASGCSQASDVGSKAFVPYSADYIFYAAR